LHYVAEILPAYLSLTHLVGYLCKKFSPNDLKLRHNTSVTDRRTQHANSSID